MGHTLTGIVGSGLNAPDINVFFGDRPALEVATGIDSYTECISPPGDIGEIVDITVVSPSSTPNSVTLPKAFTYVLQTMEFKYISPDNWIQGTSPELIIHGLRFYDEYLNVQFGTEPPIRVWRNPVYLDATKIPVSPPTTLPVGVHDLTIIPDYGHPLVCRNAFCITECPLQGKGKQTVLKGLRLTRQKGEMTAVLPVFETLEDATANCMKPGDFYQDTNGFVRIVPGEVEALDGEE